MHKCWTLGPLLFIDRKLMYNIEGWCMFSTYVIYIKVEHVRASLGTRPEWSSWTGCLQRNNFEKVIFTHLLSHATFPINSNALRPFCFTFKFIIYPDLSLKPSQNRTSMVEKMLHTKVDKGRIICIICTKSCDIKVFNGLKIGPLLKIQVHPIFMNLMESRICREINYSRNSSLIQLLKMLPTAIFVCSSYCKQSTTFLCHFW